MLVCLVLFFSSFSYKQTKKTGTAISCEPSYPVFVLQLSAVSSCFHISQKEMATHEIYYFLLILFCGLHGALCAQEILIDAPLTLISLPASGSVELFIQNELDQEQCFFAQFVPQQRQCNVSISITDAQGENSYAITS